MFVTTNTIDVVQRTTRGKVVELVFGDEHSAAESGPDPELGTSTVGG